MHKEGAMGLTDAQLQAFQEDGFVIIDDYFHDAEAHGLH